MLYIVPSRGRPANAVELVRSWAETRTFARLMICLDTDDPELTGYLSKLDNELFEYSDWLMVWTGPRLRLGGTLNHQIHHPDVKAEPIIGFMGDDHRPRTEGWDQRIKDAMDAMGGTGVVYGNDLIQGPAIPTAVAISSDVVYALGYFIPPGGTHLFFDNAWKDMGIAMGRLKYLSDVIIEHVHPVAGKTEWDEGYKEVNSGEMWEHDEKIYNAWKAEGSYVRTLQTLVGVK